MAAVKSMDSGDDGTIDCGAGRKWLLESSNLGLGFDGQNLTPEELKKLRDIRKQLMGLVMKFEVQNRQWGIQTKLVEVMEFQLNYFKY